MHWPVDDFWRWWHEQPELRAADQQREEDERRQAWQIQKAESRIARHEEKLLKSGLSWRHVHMLKKLAGVTPEQIEAELSVDH